MNYSKQRFYYVVHLQYLGFRYSGWQKQPGQRTIESMLHKTLKFILPGRPFKILGAGRTDAKVSALDAAFELFLEEEPIENVDTFLFTLNLNLPADIKALKIYEVDAKFNIIKDNKLKEYTYFFSFGQKNHPFSAPFLANILADLDIELMKEGAGLFIGTHDFSSYTARLQENTKTIRTIHRCEIMENRVLTANFFPEKSYVLRMEGQGFMRYQVRMMMGALILLGKGEMSLTDIQDSLKANSAKQIAYVAPGSGLVLSRTTFK
jgi:tRNA pseudouridine38-40 synthase